MHHAGHLTFIFRLDGDTVASVAGGNHGILQIVSDGTAVSYTHLDVYKRQGYPCEADFQKAGADKRG